MKKKKEPEKPARLSKIIAVVNHKGGVGKTTTALNTAYALARKGFRVLCVDLDPQANLTLSLLREDAEYETIGDAIVKESDPPVINIFENFDIAPSSLSLTNVEYSMLGTMEREYVITDLLKNIKKDYDYIFLDCPPSIGILTINALVAANYALITMTPEALPYKGLSSIMVLISQIIRRLNTKLQCAGILFTKYEGRKDLTKNIEMAVRKVYDGLLFDTRIRKCVKVAEAPAMRKCLLELSPISTASADYSQFADELLGRIETKPGRKRQSQIKNKE